MPKSNKQSFTFNSFSNGHSRSPSDWKTYGAYSAGIDLLGIADISGTYIGGRPNVPQLSQNLKRDAVSATTIASVDYHLTGLPEWIKRWDGINANELYALVPSTSGSSTGLILRSISGTGAWVSAHTTLQGVGGGGLFPLSANLYYGQDAALGQITSAFAFTDTFASFTLAKQTPRPMKVFAGVLNIGNDRYISTVDSSGAFVANALTLPAGYTVRSLEVLGDYLIISADFAASTRIFLWTGGTATFQEAYDIPEITAPVLVSKEGRVYAIGSQIYQLNEVSYTTIFPYSTFGLLFPISPSLAIDSPILGETAVWRNRILFGVDQPNGGTANADDVGGVWQMGNNELQTMYSYQMIPMINTLAFLLPTSSVSSYTPFDVQTGGIYADHTSVLKIGFRDTNASSTSAQYGIATLDTVYTPVNSNYAYYVTLPINCDTDVNKIFHSIRLTMGATAANIGVYYRLNTDFTTIYAGTTASNWTFLKNVSNTTNNIPVPIRQMGRNIQFKFVFIPTGSTSPQISDYTLVYELLDQYR